MGRKRAEPHIYSRPNTTNRYAYYHGTDGQPRRVSTKTSDPDQAETFLWRCVADVDMELRGIAPAVEAKTTTVAYVAGLVVKDLSHREKPSARTALSHSKHVIRLLGRMDAHTVTWETLQEYQKKRMAEKLTEWRREMKSEPTNDDRLSWKSTIDKETALFTRGSKLAVRSKRMAAPVSVPKLLLRHENRKQVQDLDFPTCMKLLAAVSDIDADLGDWVAMQFWTGWRNSQISTLSRSEYFAPDGEPWPVLNALPENMKVKKEFPIAVAGVIAPIIERRLAARRTDTTLLFHRDGRSLKAKAYGLPKQCYKIWDAGCEVVGATGLRPYDLRRMAVPRMRRLGIEQSVREHILGQLPTTTHGRYDTISLEDTADAFERLATWAIEQEKNPAKVSRFRIAAGNR